MSVSDESLLTDDFLRQITAAGEVDILVGVPTLNNHDTIDRVISAIRVGFVKYFPRERAALVNVDGGSNGWDTGDCEGTRPSPITEPSWAPARSAP